MALRIDDLPAEQLQAALAVDRDELPEEEARAIEEFLARIGGWENAILAVELLGELEKDTR